MEGEGRVWYYQEGGTRTRAGPVNLLHLQTLCATGLIRPGSYVWRQGFKDWVRAQNVQGLPQYLTLGESTTPSPLTKHAPAATAVGASPAPRTTVGQTDQVSDKQTSRQTDPHCSHTKSAVYVANEDGHDAAPAMVVGSSPSGRGVVATEGSDEARGAELPPTPESKRRWFYVDPQSGANQGPVDMGRLSMLLAQGAIDGKTLLWSRGMDAYRPLDTTGVSLVAGDMSQLQRPEASNPLNTASLSAANAVVQQSLDSMVLSGSPVQTQHIPDAQNPLQTTIVGASSSIESQGTAPSPSSVVTGPTPEKVAAEDGAPLPIRFARSPAQSLRSLDEYSLPALGSPAKFGGESSRQSEQTNTGLQIHSHVVTGKRIVKSLFSRNVAEDDQQGETSSSQGRVSNWLPTGQVSQRRAMHQAPFERLPAAPYRDHAAGGESYTLEAPKDNDTEQSPTRAWKRAPTVQPLPRPVRSESSVQNRVVRQAAGVVFEVSKARQSTTTEGAHSPGLYDALLREAEATALLFPEHSGHHANTIPSHCRNTREPSPQEPLMTPQVPWSAGVVRSPEVEAKLSILKPRDMNKSWSHDHGWPVEVQQVSVGNRSLLHAGALAEKIQVLTHNTKQLASDAHGLPPKPMRDTIADGLQTQYRELAFRYKWLFDATQMNVVVQR